MLKKIIALTITSLAMAYGSCNVKYQDHIVHYADEDNHQTPSNRLITIDYQNMQLLEAKNIDGVLNHHADPLGYVNTADYMLLIPKGSNYVNVYEIKSGNFVKKIRLPFRPRSADAYNPKKHLVILNSRDRAAAVLIDTKKLKIVGFAGFNIKCNREKPIPLNRWEMIGFKNNFDPEYKCLAPDFGGDQISGHPLWISQKAFVILDRANRAIEVYKIHKKNGWYQTTLIQVIKTKTSMHQIIPKNKNKFNNKIFFGMTEGNKAKNLLAGVYKFKRFGNYLLKVKYTSLNSKDIQGFAGHNLYITPNRKYLYAPSGLINIENSDTATPQGAIFVIDTKHMNIKKVVKAGYGAGHVAFSKQKNIAIVTNHLSNFLTAINFKNHKFIKNIYLDFPRAHIASLLQSHMQYISKDGEYYYNFWSDGGYFFRVNLDALEVDNYIKVGGVPIQGNFYDKIAINCDLPPISQDDRYEFFFGENSRFKNPFMKIFKYKVKHSKESSKYHNDYGKKIIKRLKRKFKED